MVEAVCRSRPDVSVTLEDGALHQIWVVAEDATHRLFEEFATVPKAYIVDGHHRAAASLRHADRCGADASHPAGRMLVSAYPTDQLRIDPYHRWIAQEAPAEQLEGTLGAERTTARVPAAGEAVAVTSKGCWSIELSPFPDELDAGALYRTVLKPLLGVRDERTDSRMEFIPDREGLKKVIDRVAEHGGTGFMLAPATVSQVIRAADNQMALPPKATYFVPKPRSGFFLSPRHADQPA